MTGFCWIAPLSMFVTHREILEKSSVPHLSAILCRDRWATELLTTWFVGKRETSYIKSADAGGGSEMEQGMAVQVCGIF